MQTPAVNRSVLVLMAGVVWSIVGLVLIGVAGNWMISSSGNIVGPLLIGTAAGILVYYYGFSRLARTNLIRIAELSPTKSKVCLFAFQAWRSYLIIIVMMLLGFTLRHLPIPRLWLAPVYLAIGLGLALSSVLYYARLQ